MVLLKNTTTKTWMQKRVIGKCSFVETGKHLFTIVQGQLVTNSAITEYLFYWQEAISQYWLLR